MYRKNEVLDRYLGHNEVEGLLFLKIKSCFDKTGCHFYDHVMNHIPFELESHAEQGSA